MEKIIRIASKTIFALLVAIVSYVWGGITVHEQLFPFHQVQRLRATLIAPTGVVLNADEFPSPNTANADTRTQYEIFHAPAEFVMIGDSITHRALWNDLFPGVSIANRGISGDKTSDVLSRLDAIIAVQPRKAFIMLGINDIFLGRSIEAIFKDYTLIIDRLQTKNVTPLIQSTLECSKRECGKYLSKVRDLNTKLKQYASEQNLTFIDLNRTLSTMEGGLIQNYTFDGVHLLGRGYLEWAKIIKPYFRPK